MRISAYIMTCDSRRNILQRTLIGFAKSGWEGLPIIIKDEESSGSFQDHQIKTSLRLLKKAIEDKAEFVLFLEDDLEFNRLLKHNILSWAPLRGCLSEAFFFGSLYNPGIRLDRMYLSECYAIANPDYVYGSQAFVLSKALIKFLVRCWDRGRGMQDIRISRLASEKCPLYYHVPSLVQHLGDNSTWGGKFHQAIDFDRTWKNWSASELGGAIRTCED